MSADPFAPVLALLEERAGLVFSPARTEVALSAIERAMGEAGEAEPARYRVRLERDAAALAALLDAATVGETYFFRDPAQWDFVRREAIPAVLARRAPGHTLRAWSAACATGEEPYTLSIVCHELGLRRSILGTDLSEPRLVAAREARYGRWSLRGVDPTVVRAYFRWRGSRYELVPAVRAGVEFRRLNLVDGGWPSARSGVREMDLVFCRNALIYLSPDAVAGVARRLVESLAEGGWLFTAPSDPNISEHVPCEVVVTPAGLAYRKLRPTPTVAVATSLGRPDDVETPPPPAAAAPHMGGTAFSGRASAREAERAELRVLLDRLRRMSAADGNRGSDGDRDRDRDRDRGSDRDRRRGRDSDRNRDGDRNRDEARGGEIPISRSAGHAKNGIPPLDEVEEAYAGRDYEAAARGARARLEAGADDARTWTVRVRALANRGALAEAEAEAAAALERHRAHAELHYLHALLLAQAGRTPEAAAAVRQATYLSPDLAVAHLLAATLAERTGNAEWARRSLRAAEDALALLPADAPAPGSDGETAAHLLRSVRARRALLTAGAA